MSATAPPRPRPAATGGRQLTLNFHGLGSPPHPLSAGERDVWLEREHFEAILDAVATRPDVRITFDDGNASDLHVALPALTARGLTATFFICAGRLGVPGYLDEAGVLALVGAGMSIGSHGMHHRPWRGLTEREAEEELVDARRRLRALTGGPVMAAACPFGAYDRRLLTRLRRLGYERVYTSDGGDCPAGAWLQARTTLRRDAPMPSPPGPRSAGASARRAAKLTLKRWR